MTYEGQTSRKLGQLCIGEAMNVALRVNGETDALSVATSCTNLGRAKKNKYARPLVSVTATGTSESSSLQNRRAT